MIVRRTGDFPGEYLYSLLDPGHIGPAPQGVIVGRSRFTLMEVSTDRAKSPH